MNTIRRIPDPTRHWCSQREVHLDVVHIQRSPVTFLWSELHTSIEDAVFVIRIAKFEAK